MANYCNFVVAMCADEAKLNRIQSISHEALRAANIDLIHGDITQMKQLSGDVVFIHPTNIFGKTNAKKPAYQVYQEDFSIFKHLEPNLKGLVVGAFKVTQKVAILLPGYTNLDELATLFHIVFEETNM